ncbi:cell division protein FtsL [Myxococcus sp. CA051A]|uniref:Cell division protein FtsL n=1 Tax=Myxococcus llanfairpwllgwyngyllgogerychwyrndrobwllllantysiliogogogochensis TaxID=2590453 RepID=A0A540WLU9_9BACT|nr:MULTISPECIES: cell division protein FtsL [Myxococcus]NTX00768.1 cell division protein FtsL [Myxococcus sp. CA040A]NTX12528.1 cell division protein FtsL [Myxococcus sp. CA056]NTX33547.1 cell division protein FtsL [Myxococcus sp. CA033]NTX59346.1 cell division protein FtsL [Myxococcus sp. CA051A]TQF09989.1 cell division protein FtsL [Myxococcus llanfairpwllgwyngyllgogerychwyrndrobwllllantysiliogogogochensis]
MSKASSSQRGSVSLTGVLLHLLPAVLLFSLFAAVGMLHVTSRVMVVDMGYRLSRAEAESRSLTRDNDRLKLELATLKAPGRLERVAREQLGMTMPAGSAVVSLSSEKPARGSASASAPSPSQDKPGVRVAGRGGSGR